MELNWAAAILVNSASRLRDDTSCYSRIVSMEEQIELLRDDKDSCSYTVPIE
jgi:hypothetical protein